MNILVCIKQVPASSEVKVDDKTGVIIRDGVDSKMNPYDLYALEMALELRETYGGKVEALTMGPPQATDVLKEALSMGADRAALLTDRAFAGADVLATSYAISQGINAFGSYDLILCGKQTTDGDTAQVGAEIAEFMDIEHATNITKIESVSKNGLVGVMNLGDILYKQEMQFPLILTVEKDANVPRLPSYKKKCAIKEDQITIYTLNDCKDKEKKHYGLSGSPTSVEKVFPPDKNTERKTLEGSPSEISEALINEFKEKKIIY